MRLKLLLPAVGLALLLALPATSQVPPACPGDQSIPVTLSVPHPCPGQPLRLRVGACAPCVDLVDFAVDPTGLIHVRAAMDTRRCLLAVCMPESLAVPIGAYAPGHHELTVAIDGRITHLDGSVCLAARRQTVAFDVPLDCGPRPGPLPYVEAIRVGPPPPCATCPPPAICPQAPIPFSIAGGFPNSCYVFRGLQLLPDPRMSPVPQPPIVRVLVALDDCHGPVACAQMIVPWKADTLLPGLLAGSYGMIVQVAEVSACDPTNVPKMLYSQVVPFTVAPRCGVPPPSDQCFLANWRHDPRHPDCEAEVSPAAPAKLVFQIDTGPALSGLNGRIALLPPALRVTDVRPIGAATGMQIAWQALADGATFTLSSAGGARIPPTRPCVTSLLCGPLPVLEVTVSADPLTPPPLLTLARMVELTALDTLGHAVSMCPTFVAVDMVARICAGDRVCDANRDGRSDVRDLALMVRCLRGVIPCPDTLTARFDCNGDSRFTADDILCCARRILRGPLPDSLPPRPLPELKLVLGAPVATAAGFDQSVRVLGADRLGAARLALTFPGDATLSGVDLAGDPAGWAHVEESGAGEGLLGLIPLAPATSPDLTAVLHFSAASAAGAAGSLAIADGDFVDANGVIVAPTTGVLGVPGVVAPPLVLSAARPNPFTRETSLDLTLESAGDARLGIYDLSGRLVVELFHGRLDSGTRTFTWDGRRGDGSRAADGVYFCRASAAGRLSARRLVLMRGR